MTAEKVRKYYKSKENKKYIHDKKEREKQQKEEAIEKQLRNYLYDYIKPAAGKSHYYIVIPYQREMTYTNSDSFPYDDAIIDEVISRLINLGYIVQKRKAIDLTYYHRSNRVQICISWDESCHWSESDINIKKESFFITKFLGL